MRRYTLCIGLVAAVLITAGAAVMEVADARLRIDEICMRILAEPAELGLGDEIEVHGLRKQLAEGQKRGYEGLVNGLKAYLDGRYCDGAEYLTMAAEVSSVAKFADDRLDGGFGAILARCDAKCKAGVCEECGGSGVDDCGVCAGVGWKVCRRCRGQGRITANDSRRQRGSVEAAGPVTCQLCSGLGVVKCEKCGGKGMAVCDKIGQPGHDAVYLKPADKLRIERVIAEAKYLLGGGIDVFTPGALEMAPRVGE